MVDNFFSQNLKYKMQGLDYDSSNSETGFIFEFDVGGRARKRSLKLRAILFLNNAELP